ncbi:hypothetical protein ACOMHN_001280 [Nucella lapillus]
MPAASNKPEQKPSSEAGDLNKTLLLILDKKVRNIEKRKLKLEAIADKKAAGDVLEKEQQETLKHYDSVVGCLEFARDLQSVFNSAVADHEKLQKKQLKREKQEKAAQDLKRTVEILQIQTTLDALGNDGVRDHFKSGKHGAVVLTDDNLDSLDELYKVISPPVAGEENFAEKLSTSAEHLSSLVEGKERPVAGSTYKELCHLLQLIITCGYFERAREAESQETTAETAEETEEAAEEAEEEPASGAAAAEVPPSSTESFSEAAPSEVQPSVTPVPAPDMDEPSLSHSKQVLPPSDVAAPHDSPTSDFVAPPVPPMSASPTFFQPTMDPPPPQQPAHVVPQPPKSRPLAEIVSQVEGTFSFLQDSEIDLDSPHIDPAVVAAQPMMRPPSAPSQQQQPPQTTPLMAGAFTAPPHVDQPEGGEGVDPLSQQSLTASSLDYSGAASQSFPPRATLSPHPQTLSSGVVADAMFQPSVEDNPPPPQPPSAPQQQQHGLMGQGLPSNEAVAQYDLPPSIPMPPSQQAQQDGSQLSGQEKKFQLNASATEFQSRAMYSQMPLNLQPPPPQAPTQPPSQPPHPPGPAHPDSRPIPPPGNVNADFTSAPNFAQAAGDFSQGGNFQYHRGGRGGGGPGYRGGPRGGGRGGNNGNAMQNGFNNRPQNGNPRLSNRGGQGNTFQGFPPRTDYRPDGFQGYNANGFGGGAAFQKRGGAGGPGFSRGGNNRGAGGMRGGVPRGGPPRGAGGNRGGMNRPGNQ